MIESTDQEFTDGLSPRVVVHDPRLPTQHTLDARQFRVLHRAIDTLAFTAEQYRAPVTAEQYLGSAGAPYEIVGYINQPAYAPGGKIAHGERIIGVRIKMPEWEPGQMPSPAPVSWLKGLVEDGRLPRGVAELIDATTSAWQPIMSELIEQQARFQRGD